MVEWLKRMAKERGVILSEVKRDKSGVFDGYIKLTVKTEKQTRSAAGTCFSDHKPRFIQIKGINLDAEVGQHMLYTTNPDAPGIIGLLEAVETIKIPSPEVTHRI